MDYRTSILHLLTLPLSHFRCCLNKLLKGLVPQLSPFCEEIILSFRIATRTILVKIVVYNKLQCAKHLKQCLAYSQHYIHQQILLGPQCLFLNCYCFSLKILIYKFSLWHSIQVWDGFSHLSQALFLDFSRTIQLSVGFAQTL